MGFIMLNNFVKSFRKIIELFYECLFRSVVKKFKVYFWRYAEVIFFFCFSENTTGSGMSVLYVGGGFSIKGKHTFPVEFDVANAIIAQVSENYCTDANDFSDFLFVF